MKPLRLISLTVILTSFAHPVLAGEVYKWVDENGKVHYSDRPKDDNAQVVEIKNKVTPEQQEEARQQARKLIQLQQRRVAIEMENAQDKKRQEQENALKAEELKKTCQEAEKAVRILEFQAPVFEQNGKGGKRFISDEERKQELQKLKQGISQHCATDE